MEVTLLASTKLETDMEEGRPQSWKWLLPRWSEEESDYPFDADHLAEFAGRACYQSWNRPNPKSASNAGYLANIIKQAHFSVLEHASATFYVEGVSRSLTHELVRHRHLSYSQLSQRYVDESEVEFVKPAMLGDFDPAAELLDGDVHRESDPVTGYMKDIFITCRQMYADVTTILMDRGFTRKEARQTARAVLPNATETKIVVSGNMRAWRDFLAKRWHVAADAEIREFAGAVLDHLRSIAPNIFADVPHQPYGTEVTNGSSQETGS